MSAEAAVEPSQLGRGGEIRQGDAYDLIAGIPDNAVDLIITSPPYWGLRTYGLVHADDVEQQWTRLGLSAAQVPPYDWYRDAGGVLGLEPYPAWYVGHLVEWFNRARTKLGSGASMWVNLGDTYFARWSSIRDDGRQGLTPSRGRRRTPSGDYLHDKQLLLIPARFAIAMQDAGWILRNDVIWAKETPMPRPEQDRLRLAHEHWFHFVQRSPRSRPSYYYDLNAVEDGARDVVTYRSEPGAAAHTATFPREMLRPRIASSSPDGGLVLDPFAGTGRAIEVAAEMGRRAVGFELSEVFAEHAATALGSRL